MALLTNGMSLTIWNNPLKAYLLALAATAGVMMVLWPVRRAWSHGSRAARWPPS